MIKSVLSNDLVARMLSLAVSGKYDALRDVHSTSGASAGFDITIHIILQFMHALKVLSKLWDVEEISAQSG